jgi:hypothetical protein
MGANALWNATWAEGASLIGVDLRLFAARYGFFGLDARAADGRGWTPIKEAFKEVDLRLRACWGRVPTSEHKLYQKGKDTEV